MTRKPNTRSLLPGRIAFHTYNTYTYRFLHYMFSSCHVSFPHIRSCFSAGALYFLSDVLTILLISYYVNRFYMIFLFFLFPGFISFFQPAYQLLKHQGLAVKITLESIASKLLQFVALRLVFHIFRNNFKMK